MPKRLKQRNLKRIFKSSVEEQITKPVKRRTSGSKRFTKKTKK